MAIYRILSLDGGGIRGVLTAALLDKLLTQVPDYIEKVDLLAGTPTGAILAAGLAKGLQPRDIQQLYVTRGPDIFRKSILADLENLFGITHAK